MMRARIAALRYSAGAAAGFLVVQIVHWALHWWYGIPHTMAW